MGRNAKLRHQRRAGSSEKTVRILRSRPELEPAPSPEPEKSWLAKVFDRFKPAPQPSQVGSQAETVEFFNQHSVLLSALAWEGYEKQGRGLLIVTDASSSFEVEYVPRGRVKPTLRELEMHSESITAITTAVKDYRPQSDVLLLVIGETNTIDFMSMADQTPSPPECYRQRQELGSQS